MHFKQTFLETENDSERKAKILASRFEVLRKRDESERQERKEFAQRAGARARKSVEELPTAFINAFDDFVRPQPIQHTRNVRG